MKPDRNRAQPSGVTNDIDALARYVPGIDPRCYFDLQARAAHQEALARWPLLAEVLGLKEAPKTKDKT